MTLGACGRGVCFIESLNLGLEICRNGLSRMFSFPDYISWDNTRGPILHLAPEPIILSCSTCQTSLKLSPASWPIHLLCHPWPRHLENWDPAIKTQIFILPKSQQYMALVRGKRKKPTNIGYTLIQPMSSQFPVTFHFLLQKVIMCSAWGDPCAPNWTFGPCYVA